MSKIKSSSVKTTEDKAGFDSTEPLAEAVSVETIDNFESKYLRALADYQNLSRQHLKDRQDFARYANEGLLQDFIPVYDYLKLSLDHAEDSSKWIEGVKHVLNQFKKVLEDNGVKEIVTQGAAFDHATMEAVSNEETEDESQDGLVARELKAGYTLNEKVIIPARVTVYKLIT
jgi:molecular chaperone GrpE